tara:strand:- start:764 stop:982 length:219 start_codon:yes stop_codon:yes gene_type:complete
MKEEDRKSLNDTQMLFTIITALVKREGGEVIVTPNDMDSVKKEDMLLMYFDKKSENIILTNNLLAGPTDEEM